MQTENLQLIWLCLLKQENSLHVRISTVEKKNVFHFELKGYALKAYYFCLLLQYVAGFFFYSAGEINNRIFKLCVTTYQLIPSH